MTPPPAAWTVPCEIHATRTSCKAEKENLATLTDALVVMANVATTDPSHLHVVSKVNGFTQIHPGDSQPEFKVELEIHPGSVRISHRIGYGRSQLAGFDIDTTMLPAVHDRRSALDAIHLVATIWLAHLPEARSALLGTPAENARSMHAQRIATALHLAGLNPERREVCAPTPWSHLAFADFDHDVESVCADGEIDLRTWKAISGGPSSPSGLTLSFQRYMAQDSYLLYPAHGSVSDEACGVEAVSWVRELLDLEGMSES